MHQRVAIHNEGGRRLLPDDVLCVTFYQLRFIADHIETLTGTYAKNEPRSVMGLHSVRAC